MLEWMAPAFHCQVPFSCVLKSGLPPLPLAQHTALCVTLGKGTSAWASVSSVPVDHAEIGGGFCRLFRALTFWVPALSLKYAQTLFSWLAWIPIPVLPVSAGELPRASIRLLAPSIFTCTLHDNDLGPAIDCFAFHVAPGGFCLVQPVSREGPWSRLCLDCCSRRSRKGMIVGRRRLRVRLCGQGQGPLLI